MWDPEALGEYQWFGFRIDKARDIERRPQPAGTTMQPRDPGPEVDPRYRCCLHERVITWRAFSDERPELAQEAKRLLYQHGVGLAFLATTRGDGRPRLHPMCPLISDDGLFAFIIPSPKQNDLRRDGLFAMHSFPCPDNEDAFYLAGRASLVTDTALRDALAAQFVKERSQFPVASPATEDDLFAFDLDSCLLTKTTGHGDPAPQHLVWRAAGH